MAMVWVAIHLNLRQKMRPVRETVRLLSHFVNGLPKSNPSTASARCNVAEANLSRASAPGHVTGVPELNLSPAGVTKANPSRASAPHDNWKVNRYCITCKATVHTPPGVHWDRCPECWAKYVSHVRRFKQITAEVEQEEDEGGTVTETFTDYRPSRLSIGLLHSDPIVETSSLSAVTPPEPKYNLKIEGLLGRSKALSCLQIETLVYASQRHLQHLQNGTRAGFLIGDGAGVGKGRTVAGLIWENWCNSKVKALWISVGSDLKFDARRDLDDVGAECIKVHALNKLQYSKLDSESVGVRDGVIFLTYSCLAATSAKGSRLEQLVEWCGPGYDGLIIFDECHKAKNLVPEGSKKPTSTGKAVLKLQEQLPEARVVYCSATGATEPRNMAYMVRLGLWGDGTCFRDFTGFSSALAAGGVGALELVAMNMKARKLPDVGTWEALMVGRMVAPLFNMGMYLCRSLSYKGAEFEVVEAPLNITMTETYKAAVDLWVALREELLRCPSQSRSLWISYWSTHQQFFRLMCMSAKVPTVVRLTKQALEEGKAVVIGLQSTGEARTEDAVAKYGSKLDDFISGPRELLLKFVKEQKLLKDPAHIKYEPSESVVIFLWWDCDIGHHNEVTNKLLQCFFGQLAHPAFLNPHVIPARTGKCSCYSCERKPNEHRKLLEGKSSFIDKINSLDLPRNPLDDIKDQLGGPDKVAEITGRRSMLVRNSSGEGVSYRARNASNVNKDMVNMHEKQQFMDGNKLIAIISEAGSAGVSLQADRRAANQKRRVQITLELPWSADRAIQQFGRTHRSNQASAPQYRLLITNLGGERRFAATVAKRLESLGALTQGDRRAGPSLSAYNYVSKYGKTALRKVYEAILEKATFPVPPPGCSFQNPDSIKDYTARARTALVSVGVITEPPHGELEGSISNADMGNVERFLNRLLGMPPEIQNSIFELFVTTLEHEIQNARLQGTFDKGVIGCKAKSIKLQGPPKIVYVDHTSGASAKLHTFKVDRGVAWETVFALLAEKQSNGSNSPYNGFYESETGLMGRRHILLAYESSTSGIYKTVRPYLEMAREIPLEELQKKYTKIANLERARTGWEKEHTISSKQCMHGPKCRDAESCQVGRSVVEVFVLGGVILPLWSIVEKTLAEQVVKRNRRLKVMHIETTDGSLRVVGFHIPHTAVTSLLKDLKLGA